VATERKHRSRLMLASLLFLVVAAVPAATKTGNVRRVQPRKPGQVRDWSSRHIVYPQGASLRALVLSQRDPRAYWNYLRLVQAANVERARGVDAVAERGGGRAQQPLRGEGGILDGANGGLDGFPGRIRPRVPKLAPPTQQVDWSLPLGAAGLGQDMFPAKFSFDVNAAPDCTNDYVVYTLDTAPSGTQANIVAFNNLYSGSAGSTGICGAGTATVLWAYQVSTAALPTSPIISLDGTKVAFVDGANPAVFHVLTWTAGEGSVFAPNTPTPSEMVDVTLTGATTDSFSSPFIDYYDDAAYVATDNGKLYKITGVFKGTPALAGGPWPRRVGFSAPNLTSPVIDFSTGEIFLGSTDGNLYAFTKGGAQLFPVTIGNGGATGGIVDAPVVDGLNGLVYVATGSDFNLSNATLTQLSSASFSPLQVAPIGDPGAAPLHAGTFNDAYFSSMTNTDWFFYVCGVASGGSTPVLYRVGFDATRTMSATVDGAASVSLSANAGEQCSPMTEINNGVDRIFLGLLTSAQVEFFDISTNATPTLGGTGGVLPVSEAGGTSGIIIDNVSGAAQASSIYFSTLGASSNCAVAGVNQRCAVKLTQAGLQ